MGCHGHSYKHLDSMERKEFLDKLSDFEPLKKPRAPWN
jgi:hypothetical protein